MLLLQRDALIVTLALGVAAALYAASFNDLVTAGSAYDGFGFSTLSLQLHNTASDPANAG